MSIVESEDDLVELIVGSNPMEQRNILSKKIESISSACVDHPLFNALQKPNASNEVWNAYVRERLASADGSTETAGSDNEFEAVLLGASQVAKEQNLITLSEFLLKNYKEERGLDNDGNQDIKEAHRTWRATFKSAINTVLQSRGVVVSKESSPIGIGTEYLNALTELQTILLNMPESIYMTAGALYCLERIIADEYARIEKGLDTNFPEIEKDDRKYINGHAFHDIRHAAELLEGLIDAIEICEKEDREKAVRNILFGARFIAGKKRDVFQGIWDLIQ